MKQKHVLKKNIGWQSWSPINASYFKIPVRNYSPFKSNFRKFNIKNQQKLPPRGWSSWGAYGTSINEDKILAQANYIKKRKLHIKTILIDDGWTTWGDWISSDVQKFPKGMYYISKKLKKLGFQPGIWVAPFLVHPQSLVATYHPDWLVHNSDGSFTEGRKITSFDRIFPYKRWILDISNKSAKKYMENVFHTLITDWGFTYIKLDFLYAQHFNPTCGNPDEILHNFLKRMYTKYPHVYWSACGAPLAPCIGVVDSMRISEDIVNPQLRGKPILNTFIHTKRLQQLVQNFSARLHTKKYWHLDPDVFVCDPTFGLSKKNIRLLYEIIHKANGVIFLGDNLLKLSETNIKNHIIPLLSPKPFF